MPQWFCGPGAPAFEDEVRARAQEDARGHGHARHIVDELVGWLRGAGIGYIQLHASQAGKPVYEAAGFVAGRYPGMELEVPRVQWRP